MQMGKTRHRQVGIGVPCLAFLSAQSIFFFLVILLTALAVYSSQGNLRRMFQLRIQCCLPSLPGRLPNRLLFPPPSRRLWLRRCHRQHQQHPRAFHKQEGQPTFSPMEARLSPPPIAARPQFNSLHCPLRELSLIWFPRLSRPPHRRILHLYRRVVLPNRIPTLLALLSCHPLSPRMLLPSPHLQQPAFRHRVRVR